MSTANLEAELEGCPMSSTVSCFNTPEGMVLGIGKTVGNGVEGWAPGAMFIHTDGSTGSFWYQNVGTKTTASWQIVEGSLKKVPVTKTSSYTCLAADSGTHFNNLGAEAAVTFTLPAVTNTGWEAWFHSCVLAQNMVVASADGDDMVVANDIAADSLTFSTANEIAGYVVHVISNGTLWLTTTTIPKEAYTHTIGT